MLKSQKDLELDSAEANRFREQRLRLENEMTPERIIQLEKAVYNSTYTNPELTASIGLSGIPIDAAEIHQLAAIKARKYGVANQDNLVKKKNRALPNLADESSQLNRVTSNIFVGAEKPLMNGKTLVDLLRLPNQDFDIRRQLQPIWWDEVDPSGFWRNLEVPEITDAKQLLNLEESQVIKLLMSKTEDEWNSIPGMVADPQITTSATIPTTKTATAIENLKTKFPTVKQMLEARERIKTGEEKLQGQLGAVTSLAGWALSLPFKVGGAVIPDKIGVEQEIAGVPLNIPIAKPLGALTKGVSKTIVGGFMTAQQATKYLVETGLLELSKYQGGFAPTSSAQINVNATNVTPPSEPFDLEKFKSGLIEGNIFTQIVRRAISPNETIDVGGGYFPSGPAMDAAIAARDASLPQVGGETFTVGRWQTEPLIQANLIDRNSYSASLMSGIVDATFVVATDVASFTNPIKGIKSVFSIDEVAATSVARSRYVERIREKWEAARKASKLSTVPKKKLPIIEGRVVGDVATEEPRFAGYLPPATNLPEEIDNAINTIANQEIEKWQAAGNSLEALDSPPSLRFPEIVDERTRIREAHGIVDLPNGQMAFNPMRIDEMPFTFDGKRTLTKLTQFKNAGEMYEAFLGKMPIGLVQKIQDAVEVAKNTGRTIKLEEIHAILKEGVLSGDPLYNIREVPGLIKQVFNETGKQIAYWTSGYTRQFAIMPRATFFSFEDGASSIKDMKKIMEVMNVPIDERQIMLSEAIKVVVNGDVEQRFKLREQFHKTVLGPKLLEAGVPQEWIDEVAKFENLTDGEMRFAMDADGRPIPVSWYGPGAGQVMRSIDLMHKGFMMVNPDNLKRVIRETTELFGLSAPFRGELGEKVYQTVFKNLEKVQANILRPIALGAPFPIRMVTRIIPDEMARLAVAGDMDLATIFAAMSNGALNYTTAGEIIITAKQMEKLLVKLDQLEGHYVDFAAATAKGETKLADTIQEMIDSLEGEVGSRTQIRETLSTYNQRMETLVPGMSRNLAETAEGLMFRERQNPQVLAYERQNIVEPAFKDYDEFGNVINLDGENNTRWVIGTARDMVAMSKSPEYVEVAKALLAGGGKAVEALPERFLTGDLKKVFDKIYKKMVAAQGSEALNSAPYPINTYEGAVRWVDSIYNDLLTRTSKDPAAVGVVASGQIGGMSIETAPRWTPSSKFEAFNVFEASTTLKDFVKRELLPLPKGQGTDAAPFSRFKGKKIVQEKAGRLTKFFSLYRDTSLKVARTPLQQYSKWKRVIELVPAMAPKEAAKMLAALEKTDIEDWITTSIRNQLPKAQGTATAKQVDLLGEMHGHQQVDDILYNYENKTYFGYKHNLIFGFFDAWKEQWQVWGRALAENPALLERGRLAQEGLQNVDLPDSAGLEEGQGIFYTDPNTQQQAIAIPWSKPLLNAFGLNAQESLSVKGLSIIAGSGPGAFGVGAVFFDSILPQTEAFEQIRNLLFPYGDPTIPGKFADYLIPAWGQGIASGSIGLAEKKFGAKMPDLIDNFKSILGSERNDSVRMSTLHAVMTNIASNSGTVPRTNEEQVKLLEEVAMKSDMLAILKGIFRIFSPSASFTTYYTKIGEENLAAAHIMDDLRKITDAAPSYYEGVTQFLNKYPDSTLWAFLSSATTAQPGVMATKEYGVWQQNNQDLLKKYPLVGGYLGPQEGEYDQEVFKKQRAQNLRTPNELKLRQDESLNKLATSMVLEKSREIIQKGLDLGYTERQVRESDYYEAEMRTKRSEISKEFPSYRTTSEIMGEQATETRNNLREIELLLTDKKVTSTPVGVALKEYWDRRADLLGQLKKYYPNAWETNGWRNNTKNAKMRLNLFDKGVELVEKYPEFRNLWENVLLKEFLPPEESGLGAE